MRDIAYLAWRYLAYHKFKSVVLVASITLILYLPFGLDVLVDQSAQQLTQRAQATPLLIGAKGSALELVLNSLYLESDTPPTMPYSEVARVVDSGLGQAIPLYTRFRTPHGPILGTTLDYFAFRDLHIAEGRQMVFLGECVLGATAARKANLGPGDAVVSSPENVFDLAGIYPLRMKVVGVLEPSGTPDDLAVFVDIKTAWVIEGHGHGHQDLSRPEAATGVLRQEGRRITANASVLQYNEITPENLDSFHFHGDQSRFPVTSILAVPAHAKAAALLQGRYTGKEQRVQIVKPEKVMQDLLGTVLTVRRYVVIAILIVGLSTLATMTLVFMLSLQLRRREMLTMRNIGASKWRTVAVVAAEILGVLASGALFAAVLSAVTLRFAGSATRLIIQLS